MSGRVRGSKNAIGDRARFDAKVVYGEGCWLWVGARSTAGYGQMWLNGRLRYAHRIAYVWARGPIPEGMTLDHLCRTRHCVNPAHLEVVTVGENVRRGTRWHPITAMRRMST